MRKTIALIALCATMAVPPAAMAESRKNNPAIHKKTQTVGQGSRAIARDAGSAAKKVGNGVSDTTTAIGHGTREFFQGIGEGLRKGASQAKE